MQALGAILWNVWECSTSLSVDLCLLGKLNRAVQNAAMCACQGAFQQQDVGYHDGMPLILFLAMAVTDEKSCGWR
jgi:hypothetical protein